MLNEAAYKASVPYWSTIPYDLDETGVWICKSIKPELYRYGLTIVTIIFVRHPDPLDLVELPSSSSSSSSSSS